MNPGADSKKDNPGLVVALAGPPETGAIGAVQLAGLGAQNVLQKYFSKPLPDQPGKIRLGTFLDRENNPVDQVLVVRLPVPHEFFEITAHGGVRILQRILDTLEHAGAALVPAKSLIAENLGLTDPVAKEAYRLLPEAKTTLAVKFLLHQAEQGIPPDAKDAVKYWPAIKFLLTEVNVVLVGPPNAGKSTLLNALGQMEHALVADFPGTTRDYVQAAVDLGGLPVTLVDTAGLGATADPLAGPARQKTFLQINAADCLFLVLDAAEKNTSRLFLKEFQSVFTPKRAIVLLNKIDHPTRQFNLGDLEIPPTWPGLEISALKQLHLEKIPPLLWKVLGLEGFDYHKPTIFSDRLTARLAGRANSIEPTPP